MEEKSSRHIQRVLTDCMNSLQRRMLNEQDVIQECNDIIEDQVSKGIVEKLRSEEINTRAEGVHYLPHHAENCVSRIR